MAAQKIAQLEKEIWQLTMENDALKKFIQEKGLIFAQKNPVDKEKQQKNYEFYKQQRATLLQQGQSL